MALLYRSLFTQEIISAASWKDSEETRASLEGLRDLLPKEVDLSKNSDLITIAFNASVANYVNNNDDLVGAKESLILASTAINKPLNLEHKAQKIVGHLLSSGFSTFGKESNLISADEAAEMIDPFNVSFGGVVYRKIFPDLGQLIMDSTDPDNKMYHKISTSFEVAFSKYEILVGSKYLKDAEVISDPKQVAEFRKYLRKYGGSGFYKDDGKTRVYRKIVGEDILTIGHGLVANPAAPVKGVIADNGEKKSTAKSFYSLFSKKCVKPINVTILNQEINMDIEQTIEEMAASIKELVSKEKTEETTASLAKEIASKLKELNAEWVANRDKAMKEKDAAEAKQSELYAQMEKVSKTLAEQNQKLWEMEENSRATKTLVRYNDRMAAMDEEYEMDDEDRSVVASEIKALDEKDESFAAFKEKMGKLWKHKNKTAKASFESEKKAEIEKLVAARLEEITKASTVKTGDEDKAVEDALDNAVASKDGVIPNNNESSSTAETLIERYKKSFNKDSIKVI